MSLTSCESTHSNRAQLSCLMSLINIPLIVKEYVIKMLHEASVGMKALIVDDLTVSSSFFDLLDLATNLDTLPC